MTEPAPEQSVKRKCLRLRRLSARPPRANIAGLPAKVPFAPILLKKSFWGIERKFLEPLMRFARGDVRDHIG